MIVRDEIKNLPHLDAVLDYFQKEFVHIIDCWSQDGTREFLQSKDISFKIYDSFLEPLPSLLEPRNLSISLNAADYVFILDADEYLSISDIKKIEEFVVWDIQESDGYFIKRTDYRYGEDKPFEDYKLAVLKKWILYSGWEHGVAQHNIRQMPWLAKYIPGVQITHRPDPSKNKLREIYIYRLYYGITKEPENYRYYRFLWYTFYKKWEFEKAIENLRIASQSNSLLYPVESLNSYMTIATIFRKQKNYVECLRFLKEGCDFLDTVKDDFEVKINFRMGEWFRNNINLLSNEEYNKFQEVYEFWF